MPATLDYAMTVPWHRRRRWLAIFLVPTLILSYALAVPHFRTFRAHQIRRGEIRAQFETQLQAATKSIDEGNTGAAAIALVDAEFPIRIERRLFGRSELAKFDRRLDDLHSVIDASYYAGLRKSVVEAAARAKHVEDKALEDTGDMIVTVCSDRVSKSKTIALLQQRAGECLRAGKDAYASKISEQIAILEPTHRFDAAFWANAQLKP